LAGRGKHGGDVHSRASERNRGNALDRISLGGDLESACGESLIVALSGGAIGCGVAFGLFKVFALNADALGPFVSLHVPPFVLAETLGVAALIGLF